jgi:tetratricopeptide (TPR) repeat protein
LLSRYHQELHNRQKTNGNPNAKQIHSTRSYRTGEPATDPHSKKKAVWPVAAILLFFLFGAFWLTLYVQRDSSESNDTTMQQALQAYHEKRFEDVLDLCPPPANGSQPIIGCVLLRATVLFLQGDLEGAEKFYKWVQNSSAAAKEDIAEAWLGAGRISAIRGNPKEAIEKYEKAAQSAPRNKEPLIALAMINEQIGNDREAINLLNRAKEISLEADPAIHAMLTSLTEKLRLHESTDRMARVDRLIDELTVIAQNPEPTSKASSTQNQPVGVWVMNTKVTGNSLQEGAPQLMTALIEGCFQKEGSFKVVDRHLLNETLSELKISSSELTDQNTRLQLGRLQSARLMVDGRIVFLGSETQVTLRCIDMETSQVVSIVVEVVNAGTALSTIAQQTAEKLIEKIHQNYS